jgi:hypothetical protein
LGNSARIKPSAWVCLLTVIGSFNTFVSAVKRHSQLMEIRSRFLKFSATVKKADKFVPRVNSHS